MTLPWIGQLTGVGEQLSREVTSATRSLSQFIPSGWTFGIALLLLLPLLGLVVHPALRLGGALSHSIAAIGSALIVCISSFAVLLIQHLNALIYALRPSPRIEPALRIVVPVGVISYIAYRTAVPLSYLLGAAIITVLVLALLRLDTVQAARFARKMRGKRSLPIAVYVGIVACIISLAVYSLYLSRNSLHSCLVGGRIQQDCVAKLNAERF